MVQTRKRADTFSQLIQIVMTNNRIGCTEIRIRIMTRVVIAKSWPIRTQVLQADVGLGCHVGFRDLNLIFPFLSWLLFTWLILLPYNLVLALSILWVLRERGKD